MVNMRKRIKMTAKRQQKLRKKRIRRSISATLASYSLGEVFQQLLAFSISGEDT